MAVTSDSLFHFTRSLANLKGILTEGFRSSFCKEQELYLAMVCFCDIPLSQTRDHIGRYGGFGIGLRKEWGIKNGLNPVLYLESKSYLSESYDLGHRAFYDEQNGLFESLRKQNVGNQNSKEVNDQLNYLYAFNTYQFNLERFIKEYESRDGYRFYDEREWRYVPNIPVKLKFPDVAGKFIESMIYYKKYLVAPEDDRFIELENGSKLECGDRLKFDLNDITHLIVESQKDIPILINEIKAIELVSGDELNILCSKIFTVEGLKRDFY